MRVKGTVGPSSSGQALAHPDGMAALDRLAPELVVAEPSIEPPVLDHLLVRVETQLVVAGGAGMGLRELEQPPPQPLSLRLGRHGDVVDKEVAVLGYEHDQRVDRRP